MNKTLRICFSFACAISFLYGNVYGQSFQRTYANFQGVYRTGLYVAGAETVFGQISNAAHAVDGNVTSNSAPYIPAGLLGLATVTQYLGFTVDGSLSTARTIAGGVPVNVKFSLPQSLLSLADNVEVGVYSGLQAVPLNINGILGTGAGNAAGYRASSVTPLYSGSALLSAVNASGETELSFTPVQDYQGIYVKLRGDGLSVALSVQVFHAYIAEAGSTTCLASGAIDILSGVRGNPLVNLASATGDVTNPWSAVDNGSDKLNTFATMNTGVQVLSQVFETVVFNATAKTGDSIQLILQEPGGALLTLNLLGGLTLQTYNGNSPGQLINSSYAGLSLRLLPSSGGRYLLSVPVTTDADRVDISLGGVTGVTSGLRLYDVRQVLAAPVINGNAGTRSVDTITVYRGSLLQLTASSADPVKWYSGNGSWLADGSAYTIPSVITDGLFTATSVRNGCLQTSSSYTVYVKVLDHVSLPVRELLLTGSAMPDRIKLFWTVKGESAVSHYVLQRKGKGDLLFKDVAIILAVNQAGELHYSFDDRYQETGNILYRLMIVDESGAFSYSSTVTVSGKQAPLQNTATIYPNPSSPGDVLELRGLGTGKYAVELVASAGHVLNTSQVLVSDSRATTTININISKPGLYWLCITPVSEARKSGSSVAVFVR